jgi:hypothetical protein
MKRPIHTAIAVVLVAATLLWPPGARSTLAASSCNSSKNYHAIASSGYANTVVGTGAYTTTWTSWSVPAPSGFSDAAVWIFDNSKHYLEGGFYSGLGSTVPWTNGMLPYYTLNNGANEYDGAGDYLTASAQTWLEVHDTPGTYATYVTVQSFTLQPGPYTMLTPRHNVAQGETDNSGAWMGGGSGEPFSALWQDTSSTWHLWGFHNDCSDSPYWITSQGSYSWTLGGY